MEIFICIATIKNVIFTLTGDSRLQPLSAQDDSIDRFVEFQPQKLPN
jgi:hypothetical protein